MKRYIFIIAALTALIFTGCSNDDDRPVKTPHRSADRHLRSGDRQPGEQTAGNRRKRRIYLHSHRRERRLPAYGRGILLSGVPFDPRGIRSPHVRRAALLLAETDRRAQALRLHADPAGRRCRERVQPLLRGRPPVPEHDQHRTFQQRNGTRHRRAGRSLDAAVLRHHVGRHRLEHREYGLHERRIPADEKRPCRWTRSGCRSSS